MSTDLDPEISAQIAEQQGQIAVLQGQIAALQRELEQRAHRLKRADKVCKTLMDRVERSLDLGGTEAYALFERNILLERHIEERTRDIAAANDALRLEITQRTEAERTAVQANRIRGEFLANMSHEIRTPMNAVVGMCELTLRTALAPNQRAYLDTALSSARSLLRLLDDILDLSKMEADKVIMEHVDFSLRWVVVEALRAVAVQAHHHNLALTYHVDDNIDDRLIGDPGRLTQVLLNLLGNAIKFTTEGGVTLTVQVKSRQLQPDVLRFAVTDTGVGVPHDMRDAILQSFIQADGSTTRRYGGTGLGLTISAHLIALMGGRIEIESTVGQGSTFSFDAHFDRGSTIASPMQQRSLATLQAALANTLGDVAGGDVAGGDVAGGHRMPSRPLRILLAEDQTLNQQVACSFLAEMGHEVTLVVDGEQAVVAAQHDDFDVILMDVQMPKIDGLEATRRIRAAEQGLGRHIPIVAMTAHAMRGDRDRCLAAGMDDYLAKPVGFEQLALTMARWSEVDAAAVMTPDATTPDDNAERKNAIVAEADELPQSPNTLAVDLDSQAALERLGGNHELFETILHLFDEQATDADTALPRLLAEGDLQAATRLAHAVKGAASVVGADRCTAAFTRIEARLRAGEVPAVEELTEARLAARAFHDLVALRPPPDLTLR